MALRSKQLVEFLGITDSKVRKLAQRGKIKAKKHANDWHWLFEKEDVAEFIVSNKEFYAYFCSCKPRKAYRDSYDILLKEVQKQYERKRQDNIENTDVS